MSNRHLVVVDEDISFQDFHRMQRELNKSRQPKKKTKINNTESSGNNSIISIINSYKFDKKSKNEEQRKKKVKKALKQFLLSKYEDLVPDS
jgi:3-polyprenyl-4-hydroxybenzoate decarboxylase